MSIALHYSFRKIDNEKIFDNEQIQENLVEQVYLKCCDLMKFPEWLLSLHNLTHINISCNAIEHVPAELNSIVNLNYLDMADNRIMHLPSSLFDLTQLRYLDMSGNFIEFIPTDIKYLKNLELLKFDRNFIIEIPTELTECISIFQLSFEKCARLFNIPRNLLMMPKLINVSFRGCNLMNLPSIISSKIVNLLLNGNHLLNCVPHEAIKFIEPNTSTSDFYEVNDQELDSIIMAQKSFIQNSSEIKHLRLADGGIVNLPNDVEKVHTISTIETISLKELCLRAVRIGEESFLPRECIATLKYPNAVCPCGIYIFLEAFMTFFHEKHRTNLQVLISKSFCSKICLLSFYEENKVDLIFVA